MTITQTTLNYEMTESGWEQTSSKVARISKSFYNNVIKSIPFFKSLGGEEIPSIIDTQFGPKIGKLVSISPDRQSKTVRLFDFA